MVVDHRRVRPSLTRIEIGYDRIGHADAELLDRLMRGLKPPTEPIRALPQGLVVRESTDFSAVDSDVVAAALAYIAAHSHRRIDPDDVQISPPGSQLIHHSKIAVLT